ncbi:MAG: EamA family transporter [Bacteroidetes bacterium]|nr:EamA family transporter [Bacteroidota bacterium]
MMSTLTAAYKKPSQALVIAAFAAVYILWGSTYLAIFVALDDIPPFLLVSFRFLIAGILLYGWCRVKGEPTPPLASVRTTSVAGIITLFLGTGSLIWSEQQLPPGLAAIIVATVPLWFVILDKHQWKFHFSNKFIIIGLLIGFAGILTLFIGKPAPDKPAVTDGGNRLLSIIILLIGSVAWAAGSLYSKYKPAEGSSSMKAAIQMMAAGLISLIPAFALGEHHRFSLSHVSFSAMAGVLYLVTFGSLIGYIAYVWLLSVRPPSLVGTYAYVNPVVALLLSSLFGKELITSHKLLALGIILAGVIIVNFSKEKIKKS